MKYVYLVMFVLFCQLSFAGENYELKIKLELRTYIRDSIKILSEKKESENLDLFFPKFVQVDPNVKKNLSNALNKIDENRADLIKNLEYVLDKSIMFFRSEKKSNTASASFSLDENSTERQADIRFFYVDGQWYIK